MAEDETKQQEGEAAADMPAVGDVAEAPAETVGGDGDTKLKLVETEDRGRKTEDGRQRTEDGRRKTEDGGQRTEDGRRKTEDGGQRTEDGDDSADLIGTATPDVPPRKQTSPGFGIGVVNKFLAVVVLVILSFAVFETWSNVTAMQEPQTPSAEWVLEDIEQDVNLPTLADLLQAFSEKPIVQKPDQLPPVDPDQENQRRPSAGWTKEVRENWNMIGVSQDASGTWESILVDKSENRMHFLKSGSEVTIAGKAISVQKISGEEVVLSDGKSTVTIR